MVDIHCHILPAIDDGANSWKTAIQMCNMAVEDGIDHIVATPHANSQYRYDRDASNALLSELSEKVEGRLDLSLGCDFHLSYENFLAVIEQPSRFTIGTTRYLLVELDNFSVPKSVSGLFDKLIAKGLVPIITHPERNPILQDEPERVLEWAVGGSLVQVTANSLTGEWGPKAKSIAEWLLKRQAVHALASDAHGITSRPPILSAARMAAAGILGSAAASALVQENPLAVVKDSPIPYCPPVMRV